MMTILPMGLAGRPDLLESLDTRRRVAVVREYSSKRVRDDGGGFQPGISGSRSGRRENPALRSLSVRQYPCQSRVIHISRGLWTIRVHSSTMVPQNQPVACERMEYRCFNP